MTYRGYAAQVEKRRRLLHTQLEQANQLRLEAHLPTRDITRELEHQQPLLTQIAWNHAREEQKAFARFRKEQQIVKGIFPNITGSDWEQERARALQHAMIEHQIHVAWGKLTDVQSASGASWSDLKMEPRTS